MARKEAPRLADVDLGKTISKRVYRKRIDSLQARLHDLQRACRDAGVGSLVAVSGWEMAGRGACITKLTQRLEPRAFKVHLTQEPRTHYRSLPWMWRFWTHLPAGGEMAIFQQSWYRRVLKSRFRGELSAREWKTAMEDILDYEQTLLADRYALIKIFLHVSRKEQTRRFRELSKKPDESWRIDDEDRRQNERYESFAKLADRVIARTHTARAPWHLVAADDRRWAKLRVLELVADGLEDALIARRTPPPPLAVREPKASPRKRAPRRSRLESIDLQQALSPEEYRTQLARLQVALRHLALGLYRRQESLVVVYEGWDAAGKGGNIRRVTEKLDPRGYDVFSISAPEGDEKTHHYLWRFWRLLRPPLEKQILIFDRSWYGRVLVERVEDLASEDEWRRAYDEINAFERQLRDAGCLVAKFWLHIDAEEQKRRFEARDQTPHKRWKLTDEDWRNREKWPEYERSVEEMLERTSPAEAPWTLVAANDKRHARITTLRHLVELLRSREPV